MKQRGFTLIELLVVVLIIGILSSVALPQYTNAVEKSRAGEALMMLKTLREQQAVCILANGEANICTQGINLGDYWKNASDNLFAAIDVELPGDADSDCEEPLCGPASKNFTYTLDGQYIDAWRRPIYTKYYLETTAWPSDISANRIWCYNADNAKNWCKIIGFSKAEGGRWLQP